MKLRIVADLPVFNGKTSETIEVSGKKKPINESSKNWWVEECFDKCFWALCREVSEEEVLEFRFRSIGRHKEMEELIGIICLRDEVFTTFFFSAIEEDDINH